MKNLLCGGLLTLGAAISAAREMRRLFVPQYLQLSKRVHMTVHSDKDKDRDKDEDKDNHTLTRAS